MVDIVDASTRSRMMASIGGKNTKPELLVRRYLHSQGYRFRLHRFDLPGRPDMVLPKYKLVIFVHGCFWHRHSRCFYAASPATRKEFWQQKLDGNLARDALQIRQLHEAGWRVLTVWECGLKHCPQLLYLLPTLIESSETISVWPEMPPRPRKSNC